MAKSENDLPRLLRPAEAASYLNVKQIQGIIRERDLGIPSWMPLPQLYFLGRL